MEVLMNQVLMDLDGKPVPSGYDKEGNPAPNSPPLTFRRAARVALTANYRDELGNLSSDEMLKRSDLADKIKPETDPVTLTADEAVLIKKLIGKFYGTLIYGQAHRMIEAQTGKKEG